MWVLLMALSLNNNNPLLTKAELDRWQNALKKKILMQNYGVGYGV